MKMFSAFRFQPFCYGHPSLKGYLDLDSQQRYLSEKHLMAQFCRCWNYYMMVASWQQSLNIQSEIYQLPQIELKLEFYNKR